MVGIPANSTRLRIREVIVYIFDHHGWVDICDLNAVLHAIGRKNGALGKYKISTHALVELRKMQQNKSRQRLG
jgi:hypothetical protein